MGPAGKAGRRREGRDPEAQGCQKRVENGRPKVAGVVSQEPHGWAQDAGPHREAGGWGEPGSDVVCRPLGRRVEEAVGRAQAQTQEAGRRGQLFICYTEKRMWTGMVTVEGTGKEKLKI